MNRTLIALLAVALLGCGQTITEPVSPTLADYPGVYEYSVGHGNTFTFQLGKFLEQEILLPTSETAVIQWDAQLTGWRAEGEVLVVEQELTVKGEYSHFPSRVFLVGNTISNGNGLFYELRQVAR